jgi:cytoskeleton protein RodZ
MGETDQPGQPARPASQTRQNPPTPYRIMHHPPKNAKIPLTGFPSGFIVNVEFPLGCLPVSPMGSFGEDLRTERLSRGIALEDITAVTKISQRHLMALEQEHFRLLPGGILNKGIVRGYANALGLDQEDWTQRFLQAYSASGQMLDDDRNWTAFASNVGKARIIRREAHDIRLRWAGALVLLLVVAAATFFAVRYYGARAGWWPSVLPAHLVPTGLHSTWSWVHTQVSRVTGVFGS